MTRVCHKCSFFLFAFPMIHMLKKVTSRGIETCGMNGWYVQPHCDMKCPYELERMMEDEQHED